MNNLFFPDKSKSGLEQAKIIAIDRAKGRISIALRTGLVTTAAYLYDISDLRIGLNVVVGRISGGYVIMNQVVVSDKVKLSYGRGGIVSPIDIPPVTDILGPSLIISSHVNNHIVGTSTITISGIASDSGYGNHGISQVTINGVRADNDTALGKNAANWSKTITLTSESTVFTIIAYDNFSVPNSTTKIITIITTADVEVPPPSEIVYLDDNCSSLTGWVHDGDVNAVLFDGQGSFKLDATENGSMPSFSKFDIFGATYLSEITCSFQLYCNYLGLSGGSDYVEFVLTPHNNLPLQVWFRPDGLYVYSQRLGPAYEVGVNLVQQGCWQNWKFVFNVYNSTVDIYLEDVLQAGNVDVYYNSYGSSYIGFYAYGGNYSNVVAHLNSILVTGIQGRGPESHTGWTFGHEYVLGDLVTIGASTYTSMIYHIALAESEPGVGINWHQYWYLPGGGGGG